MAFGGYAKTAPAGWARAARFAAVVVTAVLLVAGLAEGLFVVSIAAGHEGTIGLDLAMYQERTRDFLAGDGFYRPGQLAGPYPIVAGDSMYPPVALVLLVPFAFLPAVLWWAIPLTIIGLALWRIRPPVMAWPVLALILVYPRTWMDLLYGNPAIWSFAFLAAGMAWRWPAALVPLKPTLGLFALVGVRDRRWWITAAVALAACIPFGALWADYATALVNARNPFGPEYLLGDLAIAGLLVVGLRR